jgi:ABC-type phosphate/phosphonate transport system ATPase subunit
MNMSDLKKSFDYYLANQEELARKYSDKILGIHDGEVVGVYNSKVEALEDMQERFAAGTFIVQECTSGEAKRTMTFRSRVAYC